LAIIFQNKNFSKSTLAAGLTVGSLSLTVQTGHGTRFPQTGVFKAVIWASTYTNPSDDPNREIVHATLSAGDVFDIVRSQESTSAYAWPSASKIAHVITAGKIQELEDNIIAGAAGASGYSGSGTSGYSGLGTSGYSGLIGSSGYSGYSGSDAQTSGYSGGSGYSGFSGP